MAVPVSARFQALLTEGFTLAALVEVVNPAGQVIADTSTLNVLGGRIDCDANASWRRWLRNITLVDTTGALVPTTAQHMFSPVANNELKVYVGLADAPDALILQGIFHLEGCKTADSADGLTITLSAFDRGRRFSRARRIIPKRFDQSAATPIYTAITQLLTDAYAGTPVYHDSPPHLTPELVLDTGGDPWEFARGLALSMGYELFLDRIGDVRLQVVPDPNSADAVVAWEYREGVASVLIEVDRDQSNDEVYNGWLVTGENPALGSPVRALVWDTDPVSPTYYLGPYGKVPGFVTDEKVRTVEQATESATARLNQNKGVTEGVTFRCLPNPAMEPRDVLRLVRVKSGFPETGPGSEALLVDGFSIPLTSADGDMTVACRQRRLG